MKLYKLAIILIFCLLLNITIFNYASARITRPLFFISPFENIKNMENILENISKNPENSLLIFDLDKTLTQRTEKNKEDKVPSQIIDNILFFLKKNITVAIISGSNKDSIDKKILTELSEKAKAEYGNILDNLIIYANIATEKIKFDSQTQEFKKEEDYGKSLQFDTKQKEGIETIFKQIKKTYNKINWFSRIEKGFACIIEKDKKPIKKIDDIVNEIKENLDKLGFKNEFEIKISGKFAIDITKKNITKANGVLDLKKSFDLKESGNFEKTLKLAFGDSVVNYSGDWYLYKPTSNLTIPFVYVGYRIDDRQILVEIKDKTNFFVTDKYGPNAILDILNILKNNFPE